MVIQFKNDVKDATLLQQNIKRHLMESTYGGTSLRNMGNIFILEKATSIS